ncbi:hypothetical protein [Gloeobacter morelensis]|uniref:Uncharacterized protein n=1 Tax=Gloeobacter morelensis MG652769 TaxID=2781736 RepID=A0ABY3PMI1_9CYAN|nr:hypothetical protein [Gloeobacter morelensis]UFP94907.1 hypothetical protein ISF26_01265 [Gloeobacter morelensis MG652769]
MSAPLEVRLAVFRQLPLRAQRTFIAASRANSEVASDIQYIEQLEAIHRECLAQATPEQRAQYERWPADLA